jgi:hypothetical protein
LGPGFSDLYTTTWEYLSMFRLSDLPDLSNHRPTLADELGPAEAFEILVALHRSRPDVFFVEAAGGLQ